MNDDPNVPAGTGEVTSMAADDKAPTVQVDAAQWEEYQRYLAERDAPPPFAMPGPSPESIAKMNAPSAAAATEESGVVPQTLALPVAEAPMPVDAEKMFADLMARIRALESEREQRDIAAGIPTNPIERAVKDLLDHITHRANASPSLESLRKLAEDTGKINDAVKNGGAVDKDAWETLKLDLVDLEPLFRTHELTYLPELARNVDRAILKKK